MVRLPKLVFNNNDSDLRKFRAGVRNAITDDAVDMLIQVVRIDTVKQLLKKFDIRKKKKLIKG